MLTREQIEEIQTESREKGVPVKNLLKGKDIPDHQYFWWKRKYSKPDVPEGFLPVAGSGLPAAMAAQMPGTAPTSRGKSIRVTENMGVEIDLENCVTFA